MKLADVWAGVDKRIIMGILGVAFFLIIVIVAYLVISDIREDRTIDRAESVKRAYDAEKLNQTTADENRLEFLYPEMIEELDLSLDPYRSKDFKWTQDEVSRLWIDADPADIDYFTEANHRLIWDMLKDAP